MCLVRSPAYSLPVATCNQKRPDLHSTAFRPELTATSAHLKPGLTANEPAFIRTDLHFIAANQA
jgi:hypothetical protein